MRKHPNPPSWKGHRKSRGVCRGTNRTLDFGGGKYAIVKILDELNRYPSEGTTSLDEVEAFVKAREREAGW